MNHPDKPEIFKHTHTLLDGTITGHDIHDTSDPSLHWHEVNGQKTSVELYAEGQVHQFDGDPTSAPIKDEHVETDAPLEGDKKKPSGVVEIKYCRGHGIEVKEEAVNGVPVGIIKGYIATWDLDRGMDRFIRGAFKESLIELRSRNRQIRFKDHHGRTIGGFPIDRVFEDDKGLSGVGHINLEVQQGREAFALAKQGVLSDFSVGYEVLEFEMDQDIRNIHKAIVWEGSIVDEPMNPAATVTEVKAVVAFQDLPLAERERPWDGDAAVARVREFTDSNEAPSADYRNAFVWFDAAQSTLFGGYKLPIADIVSGAMVAVPRAIFAVAAALQGARGGVDIPDEDRPKVIQHVERYYAKMGLESPFDEKQYFATADVKNWGARELERYLKSAGGMSNNAAKIIASKIGKPVEEKEDWSLILDLVKQIKIG